MKVFIDDDEKGCEFKNGVTVVMEHEGRERHVRITHEGVIIDMVLNGDVDSTICHEFNDLDPKDNYCELCGSCHEEPLACQLPLDKVKGEVMKFELKLSVEDLSWLCAGGILTIGPGSIVSLADRENGPLDMAKAIGQASKDIFATGNVYKLASCLEK